MSHYPILVTKTNKVPIDEQLAPFDENLEVAPYWKNCYCVGRAARLAAEQQASQQLGKSMDDYRDRWWKRSAGWRSEHPFAEFAKPFTDVVAALERQHPLYEQPAEGCTECAGKGRRKSTYNPDSKWDWYQVGGRWRGCLKLNPGATGELGRSSVFSKEPEYDADIARAGDIDWQAMRALAAEGAEAAWKGYQEKLAAEDVRGAYLDYGVEPGDTRKSYVARRASTATYAVLHDGEWHAAGKMRWFGVSNDQMPQSAWEKEFFKIVDGLDPDDQVTVVDCHI